jgi:hypothetical protein
MIAVVLLTANYLYGDDSKYYDGLKEIGSKYQIREAIIETLIETESSGNKYEVAFYLKRNESGRKVIQELKRIAVPFKHFKKARTIVATPPDEGAANMLYNTFFSSSNRLDSFGIRDADLGIMQIWYGNFTLMRLGKDAYTDYRKNMLIGAKILREECYDKFYGYGTKYIIECYNKGPNLAKIERGNFDYYKKFHKNYFD